MAGFFEKFIVRKKNDAERYLTDEEFKVLRNLQKKNTDWKDVGRQDAEQYILCC